MNFFYDNVVINFYVPGVFMEN